MNFRLFLSYFLVFAIASCSEKKSSDKVITVFCASSLTQVSTQIKNQWEKNHPEKIMINSASSGILARQIENGAQADIYLSANKEWMEYVRITGLTNSPITIASNQLAVITPISSELDSINFTSFLEIMNEGNYKISIGDPAHVPLGKYTKSSISFYQSFESLTPKLILTKDARSALRLVELGEAEIGFVYLSDAKSSNKVKIIASVPEESHPKIAYQALLLNGKNKTSTAFLDYMTSQEMDEIWVGNGFIRNLSIIESE